MIEQHEGLAVRSRAWLSGIHAACAMVGVSICWIFCSPPAVFLDFDQSVEALEPAYRAKAKDPLFDTAQIPLALYGDDLGSWSHGAKLTPRVVAASAVSLATSAGVGFYWPATIGGILVLLGSQVYVFRITRDLWTSFFVSLALAGSQVCTSCFSATLTPKPYDGIALGFVALTLAASAFSAPAMGVLGFLALWSDERSVVSLMLLASGLVIDATPFQARRNQLIAICAALVTYVASRLLVSVLAGWGKADFSLLGFEVLSDTAPFIGLVPWVALEGALIPLVALLISLKEEKALGRLAVWVISFLLAWLSCIVVLDISRAVSFLFVLLPLSVCLLFTSGVSVTKCRELSLYAAVICVMSPNVYIVAGFAVNIFPSWAASSLAN